MNEAAIAQYLTGTFENVHVVESHGTSFFFYGPMGDDNKFPFATLVTNDDHDVASNLNRPGVFRLNIGVDKATFRSLFATEQKEDSAEPESRFDFTALDQLMPHPVYGKMYWVCVLNPGAETWERTKLLLSEAYAAQVKKAS